MFVPSIILNFKKIFNFYKYGISQPVDKYLQEKNE